MSEEMKVVDGQETEAVEVAEVQVVEEKKGFHPIKAIKAGIEKHPRVAKVVGGVAIAATATLTTLAVLGRKRSDDDGYYWDDSDSDDGTEATSFDQSEEG